MKQKEFLELGIPQSCIPVAINCVRQMAREKTIKENMPILIKEVVKSPVDFLDHRILSNLAHEIVESLATPPSFIKRDEPAPYKIWGTGLEDEAINQLEDSCELPISVRGALMPDAHLGYGLPIGGVLETRNAVIPYAVGVDIACRMKMSVLDIEPEGIESKASLLIDAINKNTRFGMGATFGRSGRQRHDVMDQKWDISPITKANKDKAWEQLGTSGGGNHFCLFGLLHIGNNNYLNLPGGQTYLILLSHSGSRGTGAAVCNHYFKLAKEQHPELPDHLKNLAWLDLRDEEGEEYWVAMELMGEYASANHACIHNNIVKHLGCEILATVENHHNFAWLEMHEKDLNVIHRKGATPAHCGQLGIIPGTMADPGYIVRGKGNLSSLKSASHGAGRRMSRTKAKAEFNWETVRKDLAKKKITLLSAGLDEAPGAYKNIDEVMAQQNDLVEVVAKFEPRIVKMAEEGQRPED
jgi:tRNA-splicing ligase RtcB (3'-phosphate/5'-hydroxy nucleic acid ligase)